MTIVFSPRRIFWLRTVVIGGVLAGLLLSPKLWLSSRFYPQTPVWSALHAPPYPIDYVVFAALLLALAAAALLPRSSKPVLVFVGLALVLAALDQSRWQPWFYQYLFMLVALRTIQAQPAEVNTCRLIIVSVYFWSGLQKANTGFLNDTFPWLMEPITGVLPAAFAPVIHKFGIAVPITEMAIGLALITSRFRTAALILAAIMHGFILLAIGPWGHNTNTVVWAWNFGMAFSAFLLFWRTPDFSLQPTTLFQRLVLILFTLAPLLSFFNAWDNYLSWALYAGNRNDAEVYFADTVADTLPPEILEYVYEEGTNRNSLNLSTWSLGELNVPAYPEARVYKNVARAICSYAARPTDVTLVIQGKIAMLHSRIQSSFTCAGL